MNIKKLLFFWGASLRILQQVSLSTLIAVVSFSELHAEEPQLSSNTQQSVDSDNDGLTDLEEKQLGTERYLADTDGDGISDGKEVGNNVSSPRNTDKDKRINALDSDDDNDGLPTIFETANDTDNDGIPNYLDSDSDNDGISDGEEAGMTSMDSDNDGIDDQFDSDSTGGEDANGDGINDNFHAPDSNGDGTPDYLDKKIKNKKEASPSLEPISELQFLDENNPSVASKNKAKDDQTKSEVGLNNSTEHQENLDTIDPNLDQDHDGIPDVVEIKIGTNPKQRDSDLDGIADALEIGLINDYPQDSDHDGIIDALDDDDDGDGVLTRLEDPNRDGSPLNDDTDSDGVPNYLDANDDGDDKLTKDEEHTFDTDKDGVPDYLDRNDGVSKQQLTKHLKDAEEALRQANLKIDRQVRASVNKNNSKVNIIEESNSSEAISTKTMNWLASQLPK